MKDKYCLWLFRKHKVKYINGYGYRCTRCGKTLRDITSDKEKYKFSKDFIDWIFNL